MSRPPAPNVLSYVGGGEPSRAGAWRVALGLGVAYLLVLGVLWAADIWPMRFDVSLLRVRSVGEPRNAAFALIHTIPPCLACLNVLPVAGCALAAAGRSPRRPLLLYAAVQGSLLALMLVGAAYVVWQSPFTFVTQVSGNRTTGYTVFVERRAFFVAAAASLVLSLPLLPLLLISLARRVLVGRAPA